MIRQWFRRSPAPRVRVLMVCMGNICRSPMAEAVLRQRLRAAGLDAVVAVESAGTTSSHRGEPPDARAVARAALRGYDLQGQRARGLREVDPSTIDLVLCMDRRNLESLQERWPQDRLDRVALLLSALPGEAAGDGEVPDPYYGTETGFDRALSLIEAGCDAWMPRVEALARAAVQD